MTSILEKLYYVRLTPLLRGVSLFLHDKLRSLALTNYVHFRMTFYAGGDTNVFTVILTDDEYNILFDIFYEWNETFDIIIDIFEEETLEAGYTRKAMEILDKYIGNSTDKQFLAAAAKLKEALSKAVELGMPLYLDF